MLQSGDHLDLSRESIGRSARRDLRQEHLDRDLALVLLVVGEQDDRHAAAPELSPDQIAVAQRLEFVLLGHCRRLPPAIR